MPEVDKLYAEARYDGSRFRVPSFQAAGSLWLGLIARKERDFIAEVGRVLRTPGAVLERRDVASVREIIQTLFAEDRYVERMRIFSEGVGRKAASYGLAFNAAEYRVDIPDSAYRAAAMNALRRARENIFAELELQCQSNTPETVRSFSTWRRYIQAHPWGALTAIVFLVLLPWLFSKLSMVEMLAWFRR